MADPIPSIGDSPVVATRKIHETFPLPKSRKEVVTAFERILNLGGVQRVVVELGTPIKVTRVAAVSKELETGPEEIQEDDFVEAAKNVKMEEFLSEEDLVPTVYLFRAFHLLSLRRLKARAIVVNSFATLRKWLGVSATLDVSFIFGVETATSKDMPDDALLLIASTADDPDLVNCSLKLEMTLEKRP